MKLFTKGLLLIAIPSVLELAVLSSLLDNQEDASRAERWELHSQQVVNQAAGLIDPLLRESARVRGAAITGAAAPLADDEPWRDLRQRMAALNVLVSDDPLQLARVSQISALTAQYRHWVAQVAAQVKAGEPARYLPMLAANNTGDVLLNRIRAAIATFTSQEDRLHDERGQSLYRLRHLQKTGLVFAALGSLLIAGFAAYLFTRHISMRLARLGENAQRVADGLPLPRPIRGRDEVAALDAVLHETGRRLIEAELEYRTLSEQLRQRGAQLVLVNQHLLAQTNDNETFVYGVSHDLRSPLVNLQGFSKELLVSCASLRATIEQSSMTVAQRAQLREIVDGEFAESLHFVQNAVTRAANIVDALLRLSRAGRIDYQWREIRTDVIVERVVSAMQQTMRARGARIEVESLPPVWGDATTIEQIFANLIGNALNYLDPQRPGFVEVGVLASHGGPPRRTGDTQEPAGDARASTAPPRPTHVFFVKDNGLGIPARYLSKMFNAFQRLHGNVAKGEGIGLALVRRMVERHSGRVWLESAEGVGSTFFVELPAEAPRESSPEAGRARGTPPDPSRVLEAGGGTRAASESGGGTAINNSNRRRTTS
ncbi:MAG: ATP-binding protein [Pararobbsia sp.]